MYNSACVLVQWISDLQAGNVPMLAGFSLLCCILDVVALCAFALGSEGSDAFASNNGKYSGKMVENWPSESEAVSGNITENEGWVDERFYDGIKEQL